MVIAEHQTGLQAVGPDLPTSQALKLSLRQLTRQQDEVIQGRDDPNAEIRKASKEEQTGVLQREGH